MRWIPVAAWIFAMVGLILSLVTLLSGVEGDSPRAAAIATFNTSSIGKAEYQDPTSELGRNITTLVPADVTKPPSITQYLGIKDWYTLHYLSICSGFFAPSSSNPNLLSSSKTNITCTKQPSGYRFSISNILRDELKPSVIALADGLTGKAIDYDTKPWINIWYAGIVFTFMEIVVLPFTFSGSIRINLYTLFLGLISATLLTITSGLVTGHILAVHHPGLVSYPGTFLGLTWSSTVCLWLATCLIQLEWKFQIWTPVGKTISTYRKPSNASWFAIRPLGSGKLRVYWDARTGI